MSDDYSDLDELVVDDELSAQFTRAATYVQSNVGKLDNGVLLELYGFYKQGVEGKCTTARPSWYDVRGKSKWEAWTRLGDMAQVEAKRRYIELVSKLEPNFAAESKPAKQTWVTVSTPQKTGEVDAAPTLLTYVKDGAYDKVAKYIKAHSSELEINARDDEGLGLIHWAADRGSAEVVQLLLKSGADPSLLDDDGQTALHYAVSCGHLECVRSLLEAGADPRIKDSEGSDCFDVADDEAIKALLSSSSPQSVVVNCN